MSFSGIIWQWLTLGTSVHPDDEIKCNKERTAKFDVILIVHRR